MNANPWKEAEKHLSYPRKERKTNNFQKVLRNYSQTILSGVDLLVQVSKNRGNVKNHQKNSIYAIIAWPPKVQKPLRRTTNINFGRKTWVKFTWKIILSFIWVYSSALRDHYIQVKDKQTGSWDSLKVTPQQLNRGENNSD